MKDIETLRLEIQVAEEELQRGDSIAFKHEHELRQYLTDLHRQWVVELKAEQSRQPF